jgi:hypothetical protein
MATSSDLIYNWKDITDKIAYLLLASYIKKWRLKKM